MCTLTPRSSEMELKNIEQCGGTQTLVHHDWLECCCIQEARPNSDMLLPLPPLFEWHLLWHCICSVFTLWMALMVLWHAYAWIAFLRECRGGFCCCFFLGAHLKKVLLSTFYNKRSGLKWNDPETTLNGLGIRLKVGTEDFKVFVLFRDEDLLSFRLLCWLMTWQVVNQMAVSF